MDDIFKQARTLHTAHKNAESYSSNSLSALASTSYQQPISEDIVADQLQQPLQQHLQQQLYLENSVAAMNLQNLPPNSCYNCGHPRHPNRSQCPARKHRCKLCGTPGH